MKPTVFSGTACAIITPFDTDGKIDYRMLKKQVEYQIGK